MDIKKLKANYQIAQLRAGSDPSESNLAILEQARQEYEAALDPELSTEKKMEDWEQDLDQDLNQDLDQDQDQELDQDQQPDQEQQPDQDPQTEPITNNPLKTTRTVS